MRGKPIATTAAVVALAASAAGAALAVGGGDDDAEGRASGPAADRAVAAALRVTGGGTAHEVERDGERGATWEVEVTRPDGTTVDVRLDDSFGLVVVDGDSEAADGDD